MLETYVASHDEGRVCRSVANHTPKVVHVHRHHIDPLGWGGPDTEDNIVWLCPTCHEHVHILLRAWRRFEGEPPWELRRLFNPYIRSVAEDGWNRYLLRHVGRDLRVELGAK